MKRLLLISLIMLCNIANSAQVGQGVCDVLLERFLITKHKRISEEDLKNAWLISGSSRDLKVKYRDLVKKKLIEVLIRCKQWDSLRKVMSMFSYNDLFRFLLEVRYVYGRDGLEICHILESLRQAPNFILQDYGSNLENQNEISSAIFNVFDSTYREKVSDVTIKELTLHSYNPNYYETSCGETLLMMCIRHIKNNDLLRNSSWDISWYDGVLHLKPKEQVKKDVAYNAMVLPVLRYILKNLEYAPEMKNSISFLLRVLNVEDGKILIKSVLESNGYTAMKEPIEDEALLIQEFNKLKEQLLKDDSILSCDYESVVRRRIENEAHYTYAMQTYEDHFE